MICAKCKTEIQPTSLFFNAVAGWSCECQWGTLSPADFKNMFGISFWRFRRRIERQPKAYVFIKSAWNGNAAQRRRQRRASVRRWKAEREQ